MTRIACPNCKTALKASAEQAGMAITCPNCQGPINVPKEKMAAAQALAGNAGSPTPMPAVEQWFFSRNGKQQGPVTAEQLRGMITPNDLVWKQGLPQWVPASTIPNLLPIANSPSNTPPPAISTGLPRNATIGIVSPSPTGMKPVSLYCILILSGAGIWFLTAFLPWWGIQINPASVNERSNFNRNEMESFGNSIKENMEWYQTHLSRSVFMKLGAGGDNKFSASIFGITTGTGLFAFIFALLAIGGVITSFFVQLLVKWRWTGAFAVALAGLVILIMDLLWFFGSPSESFRPYFVQGTSIGLWLHLPGTLLILTGAILEGVFGLLAFLRGLKGKSVLA